MPGNTLHPKTATSISSQLASGGLGAPSVNPGDFTRSPHTGVPPPIPAACPPSKHTWLESTPTKESPSMWIQ
eukprot:209655-Ditylum_brightwellii.AAC.1